MKKHYLLLVAYLMISSLAFSQTKKVTIVNELVKNNKIVYAVLKSDNAIKQGAYQRISRGTISTEGEYSNDKRSGIWKVYDYDGKIDVEINYHTGTIKYPTYNDKGVKTGLVEDRLETDGDRPVINLIGTRELVTNYVHLLRYPADAREQNVMGRVVVAIKVDENGDILGYRISSSVLKSIDEEALRVIRMIKFEFLPAFKNGKPVESEILLPIIFQLAQ